MHDTRPRLRRGLHVPNFGAFAEPADVAELAALAERSGWDGLFLWDHVVRREGDLDCCDPWIALAAAAVATDRVALGPMVTPLPRRRPWNVAKSAVSLDHLSGGRAVLGVGLGTIRGAEFSAFGEETDPRARGDLLDEGLAIVHAAWSGEPVHAAGRYRVDGQRFLPRPLRPGGIPIWAATESLRGRAMRRAATLDGVFPLGIEPSDVAGLLRTVGELRGGDTTGFDVAVADDGPGERWEASGATWWLRTLAWDRPLGEALATVGAGPGG